MTEGAIIVDESFEWRCGGCAVRPMLARFGLVGGVWVHVSGRRSFSLNYVFNVLASGLPSHCPACNFELAATRPNVIAHCPACHEWRELYWDAEQQTMIERAWTGFVPLIQCRCEFERVAQKAAMRQGEREHGEQSRQAS